MKLKSLIYLFLGVTLIYFSNPSVGQTLNRSDVEIEWAKLQDRNVVEIKLNREVRKSDIQHWKIVPENLIVERSVHGKIVKLIVGKEFQLNRHYYLSDGKKQYFLIPDGILDTFYSTKPLGLTKEKDSYQFRLFAPRAIWVKLVLFNKHDAQVGKEFELVKDNDGVWELSLSAKQLGHAQYYGYRVHGPQGNGEIFDSTLVLADPYSKAVTTMNHYTHPAKSLIFPEKVPFDWEGTSPVPIAPGDLIVYEMHVRDLTAHPSSGVDSTLRGSYLGLIQDNRQGGINYIKQLGVNAVELLPVQEFGNIETPYRDSTVANYPVNTWNPYARNHWGYMTSYFFAPESYYATGGTMAPGAYNGIDGRQVSEFKEMVKAFHKNGIAVIMDVVFNHVSQYDYNPLKYIDKFYYFRLNSNCDFESASGCGNDLKTERPMTRRLIVDSVVHWLKNYHIDGFRFDLAAMIDWETINTIRETAQQVNPNVHLIAEPWGGGGYAPGRFSDYNWSAWNDQFRNGMKGWHPSEDVGFIFGKYRNGVTPPLLKNYFIGTLREYGGLFLDPAHAVNYLESHDDHTLGDFIRLTLQDVRPNERIDDLDQHARLTSKQLKINKLAAFVLMVSQGKVMIHEGQEFARSKVIAATAAPDTNVGKIDHNSYEKDNETNWLNFHHAEINKALLDYYRGLIAIRKTYSALRQASPEEIFFHDNRDSLLVSFEITVPGQHFLVIVNGNAQKNHRYTLPPGEWLILADAQAVYVNQPKIHKNLTINVPATSGVILKRL
jgi:pullulanase/glycogen debranching enzyme